MRAFSRRVLEGPRRGRRGEKRHIRMFLSEPNAVLVQPALSCHCVLTLSTVPSLVTAWQATNRNDEKRKGQILRYYTRGVCAQRIRNLKQLPKLPSKFLRKTVLSYLKRVRNCWPWVSGMSMKHFCRRDRKWKRRKTRGKSCQEWRQLLRKRRENVSANIFLFLLFFLRRLL